MLPRWSWLTSKSNKYQNNRITFSVITLMVCSLSRRIKLYLSLAIARIIVSDMFTKTLRHPNRNATLAHAPLAHATPCPKKLPSQTGNTHVSATELNDIGGCHGYKGNDGFPPPNPFFPSTPHTTRTPEAEERRCLLFESPGSVALFGWLVGAAPLGLG